MLNPEFYRVDVSELRDLMIRKIGKQRAKIYFDQLRRFFSLKIGKCDFDKFCARVLGRENVPLHNRLIRTILTNACVAKVPPSKGFRKTGSTFNGKLAVGFQGSGLQSLHGDAFSPSSQKAQSAVNRDRRLHDRPSPLAASIGRPQNTAFEETASKWQEQQSATELHSLGSRPPVENASVEDGEEVEQVAFSPGIQSRSRSPVTAPFGIRMKACGVRKGLSRTLVLHSNQTETCQNSGELPDSRSLRCRLEKKLEAESIKISTNCVNLLNISLDAYLKKLIEPCIELARSKSGNSHQTQINRQLMPMLNNSIRGSHMQSLNNSANVSKLDFCTAMELNPRILGVDWAVQFEKIYSCAFEE